MKTSTKRPIYIPKNFLFITCPNRGPKVLLEKSSFIREVQLRTLFLVFLTYLAITISLSLTALSATITELLTRTLTLKALILQTGTMCLVFTIGPIRDFWAKYLDLYRMDDTFSGTPYLDGHLNNPLWPNVKKQLLELENESLSPVDKEIVRREITYTARANPAIYEAIFELGDERLRWTLMHAQL